MEDAVVVRLRGRLGNQLFGFATGYSCARRNGCQLLFTDPLGIASLPGGLTEVIGDEYRLATARQIMRFGQLSHAGLRDAIPILNSKLEELSWRASRWFSNRYSYPRLILEENLGSPFELHNEVLQAKAPVMLSGYFQREEYFSDFASEIAERIRLPSVADVLPPNLPKPVVSVTFRRGDYIDEGWLLPLKYYENALNYMSDVVGSGSILLFSDDSAFIELAAQGMSQYGQVHLATTFSRDPVVQLGMLASCDHHVLANSTFCWWGAWIGEHRHEQESLVIAPFGWVDGENGIIPARWKTLPVGND